jgi:hypothetical protein
MAQAEEEVKVNPKAVSRRRPRIIRIWFLF